MRYFYRLASPRIQGEVHTNPKEKEDGSYNETENAVEHRLNKLRAERPFFRILFRLGFVRVFRCNKIN